jgi:hypothetical protein
VIPSFSETVASPAWRAEAEGWVREQVAAAGATVVGDIDQPRIRPWSSQLVVPTDRGRLWFKANCRAMAFEPALHVALARLDPGEVDAPFAVETHRGWVLTRDRGITLGDSHEATLGDWQNIVTVAAGMQRRLADHGSTLLAAGLPDCSTHTVPQRFAELVEAVAALPPEHPSHLDDAAADRLRGAHGLVDDAVAALLAGPCRQRPGSTETCTRATCLRSTEGCASSTSGMRSGLTRWRSWGSPEGGSSSARRCRGLQSGTRMRPRGATS